MDVAVRSRRRRIVRELAKLNHEQKRKVEEQIKKLIQKQKENNRHIFSGAEAKAVDVIPGENFQYTEFKFQLDIRGRPPYELSFYFPDIYDMVIQDPSQKVYMNYRKTYWLTMQYFAIMKLSDADKDLMWRWTQTSDYAITTDILQIFFKKNCEPRKRKPETAEQIKSIMNFIVEDIIRGKLFPAFIQDWETYEKQNNIAQQNQKNPPNQGSSKNALVRPPTYTDTTYEQLSMILSENNYAKVREAVVAFIRELYRISGLIKSTVRKFCPPEFWDSADIYVFRGHNDIDYNNPDFDHNSGVFSTSLEFSIAAEYAKPVTKTFIKVKRSENDRFVKNTIYILKLSQESNVLFTMPVSQYNQEMEVTLLPDDEEVFMQSLQDCMHLTIDDVLCMSTPSLVVEDMTLDKELDDTMRRVHSIKERDIHDSNEMINLIRCNNWYVMSPDTGYILKVVKAYE